MEKEIGPVSVSRSRPRRPGVIIRMSPSGTNHDSAGHSGCLKGLKCFPQLSPILPPSSLWCLFQTSSLLIHPRNAAEKRNPGLRRQVGGERIKCREFYVRSFVRRGGAGGFARRDWTFDFITYRARSRPGLAAGRWLPVKSLKISFNL